MTDAELTDGLRQRNASVVHFSHHAEMGRRTVFPTDLLQAIENKDAWTLSCHVIWPDHRMDLVGSVGIILQPTAISQVISVSSRDSGSREHHDGSDQSSGVPLSKESLDATFNPTGAYNEWRVKGAQVAGIFVAEPPLIYTKKIQLIGGGPHQIETIASAETSLREVIDAFPDLCIYTMESTGLKLIN
jgi:hypothetical protein